MYESSSTTKRAKHEVGMRKGVGDGRTGSWGYRGMINNKVLLKSIRKYIKYLVINHMKKNKEKIYISICV